MVLEHPGPMKGAGFVGLPWGWDTAVPMPGGSPAAQMPETDVYLSGII